jgi:hypothetical protein
MGAGGRRISAAAHLLSRAVLGVSAGVATCERERRRRRGFGVLLFREPVRTTMWGGDGPPAARWVRGGGAMGSRRRRSVTWARTLAKWARLRTEANSRPLRALSGWTASCGSAARRSGARSYPFGSSFCFWRPEAAQKLNQTVA